MGKHEATSPPLVSTTPISTTPPDIDRGADGEGVYHETAYPE